MSKITHNEPVYCEAKGCKKIIGHKRYNGRISWYDGVHQCGYYFACSEKHLSIILNPLT